MFDVFSSIKTDVVDGIDCIIDNKYAVHFWLVTYNSIKWRKRKKAYRHDYDSSEFINIELPLDPFDIIDDEVSGEEVGDFYLYTFNEVEYLISKINELKDKAS